MLQASSTDLKALPEKDASEFLAIARIVKPQGRQGEVAAEILTDFPDRFAQLRRAYLQKPGQVPEAVLVEKAWPHKGRLILKFSGVDSINQASRLRGRLVLVPWQERIPLPAHHYYVWELKGCRVVAEQQGTPRVIGTVTEVEPTGGVDLLHVTPSGRRRGIVLIPFAQEICRRIDTGTKTIVIDPPEDLLELNEES